MRKEILISIIVALTVLMAIVVAVPSTDDFDPHNPLWNGLSVFANQYHVYLVDLSKESVELGTQILMVIGPSTNFSSRELEEMKRFVANGGTLVIMDDFGTGLQVLKAFNARIETYRGILADPLYYFKSYRFPRVKILNSTVVFNYGTAIKSWNRGKCIGFSSPFSFIDLNLNSKPDAGEPKGPLCVAIEIRFGKGKVLFISDADVAINAMISHNVKFLNAILGNSSIALVAGHWIHKPYTIIRMALVKAYSLTFYTSIKYPVATTLALVTYLATCRYATHRVTHRRVGGMCSEGEIEKLIREILARHPSWNRDELIEVVREKLCRE